MTDAQAKALTAKVLGAWPEPRVGETTAAVYTEQFQKLAYAEAGLDAVNSLIQSERWRPSWAAIREEYLRFRDRYLPRAIEPPEPTPEERREIAVRQREMLARLTAKMELLE